jgi:hypothetical protein
MGRHAQQITSSVVLVLLLLALASQAIAPVNLPEEKARHPVCHLPVLPSYSGQLDGDGGVAHGNSTSTAWASSQTIAQYLAVWQRAVDGDPLAGDGRYGRSGDGSARGVVTVDIFCRFGPRQLLGSIPLALNGTGVVAELGGDGALAVVLPLSGTQMKSTSVSAAAATTTTTTTTTTQLLLRVYAWSGVEACLPKDSGAFATCAEAEGAGGVWPTAEQHRMDMGYVGLLCDVSVFCVHVVVVSWPSHCGGEGGGRRLTIRQTSVIATWHQ